MCQMLYCALESYHMGLMSLHEEIIQWDTNFRLWESHSDHILLSYIVFCFIELTGVFLDSDSAEAWRNTRHMFTDKYYH